MLLKTSLTAMFPMLSISFTGALLTYMKVMDNETNSSISKSAAGFFIPILNFAYISSSLDLSEIALIWPVLVGSIFFSVLYVPLGYAIAVLIKIPKSMRNTFSIFFAFPNYGLVFTLSQGICSPYGPLNNDAYCQNSFSYISIYGFFETLIFWTIGYSLVEKDKQSSKIGDSEELIEEGRPAPSFIRNSINTLKMPNPLSCFAGLIFAMIPGYKHLFFHKEGIFYTLGTSSKNISLVGIVWGQMMMGSNIFMMIGKKSKLSNKQVVLNTIFKVLFLPAITLAIIYGFWGLGVFGDDRVQAYLLFMCVSSPTAIVTIIFALLHKINIDEVSQCIFTVYILSMFTMVAWTFLFFLLI